MEQESKQKEFIIVLIEDNPDHIELIEEFISGKEIFEGKIKLLSFLDEYEGIEYFKNHFEQISVVLLDYTLPNINGLEIIGLLRKIDSKTPIIGLTGHGSMKIEEKFIEAGANLYISKSIEQYKKLSQIIKDIIKKLI
ncbi:MAG: response regulator [archaeon]|nr:response regulator [archaeon]